MFKKSLVLVMIITLIITTMVPLGSAHATLYNSATDWFSDAKYGAFIHYWYPWSTKGITGDFNTNINEFNATTFANQIDETGAKYVMFTLGQNSGYFCSPNATYNTYTGYSAGQRCSTRDLINDLYDALNAKGIKLMLYLPCNAPIGDTTALSGLSWDSSGTPSLGYGRPTATFRTKWADVIREWSNRYGTKIAGWWFDGGYTSIGFDDTYFSEFASAAKAGNANSIVCFNPGVEVSKNSDYEDYTAGEQNDLINYPASRWLNGLQWHMLTYLGSSWATDGCKYQDQALIDYIRSCNNNSGVVTLDISVNKDGSIDSSQKFQMSMVKKAIRSAGTNYCLSKPSKLLSNIDGAELPPCMGERYASNAVDGDTSTIAQAANEWAWTLQTDLQDLYPVNKVEVLFDDNGYATDYEIKVSPDGTNWNTVVMATQSTGGTKTHTFPSMSVRYIRVVCVKPDASGQTGGQMAIKELRAYNIAQPASGSNKAILYDGGDSSTQGNWKGVYGAQGQNVINDVQAYPSYATVSVTGNTSFTWANPTTNIKALEKVNGTDHIASCWYSGSRFIIDINLTDGQWHKVSLYCLDWDNAGRTQKISVVDAANSEVLGSSSMSSFSDGKYQVWNLKGHVQIQVVNTNASSNAVISGIFFDSTPVAEASLIGVDSTTSGNWKPYYGAIAKNVIGDTATYPSYITVTPTGKTDFTWTSSTTDVRALEKVNSTDHIASCWYSTDTSLTLDINITNSTTYRFEFYCLDWDNAGRDQTITVTDANLGEKLSEYSLSSFTNGKYVVIDLKGHVLVKFRKNGGASAVLSGFFVEQP